MGEGLAIQAEALGLLVSTRPGSQQPVEGCGVGQLVPLCKAASRHALLKKHKTEASWRGWHPVPGSRAGRGRGAAGGDAGPCLSAASDPDLGR